jgi:putative selenate reductase
VGQLLEVGFVEKELLKAEPGSYLTRLDNVFIGGDAMRGASTAINAIGDGRKAAEQIMQEAIYDFQPTQPYKSKPTTAKN